MSHFTLTVLLPKPPESREHLDQMLNELLAPFDENKPVDEPYRDYEEPPTYDAERDRWNWPYCVAAKDGLTIDPANVEPVALHLQQKWADDGSGERYQYEAETNRIYQMTTYNPNSKWDWWALGGRWQGYYPKLAAAEGAIAGKPSWAGPEPREGWVDCIRKGDIDHQRLLADVTLKAMDEQERIEAKVLKGEKLLPWDTVMPLDERIEQHVKSRLRTYAVLAEGVWREPGKMGWFGMSSETPGTREEYDAWWDQFWEALPDDAWLAALDLHI